MSLNHIHVSGYGGLTSLGLNIETTYQNILNNKSEVKIIPSWEALDGLNSHIAAMVPDYEVASEIPRSKRRTMSKMSEMICLAAKEALLQSKLFEDLEGRRVVIIVGSTTGSPIIYEEILRRYHETNSARGQSATNVFKCMAHSAAVNLCSYLDFHGPTISPSAACSTSSQAIILGQQLIKTGFADIAIVGGTDECHSTSCLSFDAAYAASRSYNTRPEIASRPFDSERDGIVVSEGAAILVLESEKSLKSRNVPSLGKILGGSYITQTKHMSRPSVESISRTMKEALENSSLTKNDIGYVNAHATSTPMGDLKEAEAVFQVLGEKKISSLKGHLGHTFAACGALEAIISLKMLQDKKLIPTRNLNVIDSELPALHYLQKAESFDGKYILSNNFAFGGMNTSMVLSI